MDSPSLTPRYRFPLHGCPFSCDLIPTLASHIRSLLDHPIPFSDDPGNPYLAFETIFRELELAFCGQCGGIWPLAVEDVPDEVTFAHHPCYQYQLQRVYLHGGRWWTWLSETTLDSQAALVEALRGFDAADGGPRRHHGLEEPTLSFADLRPDSGQEGSGDYFCMFPFRVGDPMLHLLGMERQEVDEITTVGGTINLVAGSPPSPPYDPE